MFFIPTKLIDAYIVDIEPYEDNRGFFARSWCSREFSLHGLNANLVQCNISYNVKRGTLRGMHYQIRPYEETKLVRCTMGAIFDVIIDLRRDSDTFKQWISVELTALNRRALYVPEGFAHGFITLLDHTEVLYQMSEFFHSEYARGIKWDDPAFNVEWPFSPTFLSENDQNFEYWS